jgi:hypothetical protein
MASTGALVLSASSAAAALAPTFGWLVVFRAAGGAGSSVFFAALFAYLMRTVPGDRMGRAVAGFYGSFNLGFILGPPLGGILVARFGYVSPLWAYAATVRGRRRHVPEADPQARAPHARGRPARRDPPAAVGPGLRGRARERVRGAVDRRRAVPDAAVVVRDGGARPVGVPGHDGTGRRLPHGVLRAVPGGLRRRPPRTKARPGAGPGAADLRHPAVLARAGTGGLLGRSGLRRRDDRPVGRGAGRHAVRRGAAGHEGDGDRHLPVHERPRAHARAARRRVHGAGLRAAMGDRTVRGPGGARRSSSPSARRRRGGSPITSPCRRSCRGEGRGARSCCRCPRRPRGRR